MVERAAAATTYGIVLKKGNRYFYRGVLFRYGQKREVDLATRNHLVGTGHFQDIGWEEEEPEPIPVRRAPTPKPRPVVRRGPKAPPNAGEPGMSRVEGGATMVPEEVEPV